MPLSDQLPHAQQEPPVRVRAEEAIAFGCRLLVAHGLTEADARVVAECLVSADLRGVDTHGLQFLPQYLERLRRGLINPRPQLRPVRVTPVAAILDGQNGFGFLVGMRAIEEAMAIAGQFGIGMVAARRSTHFGMAACYVLPAVAAGFIALVFSNASRAMPPWGGREALLGTNPFAAGAPAGRHRPFLLDMSTAVAARGKIRRAARRRQAIPLGYALDAQGKPTTDPDAALAGGVVLPVGGAKGSGLAMLMDIMGGVLSGAACAGEVANQFLDYDRPQNVGHLFLAIRRDLFIGAQDYAARMDRLIDRVHANPPAAGFGEVVMPGEIEARCAEDRSSTGIPFGRKEFAALEEAAKRAGVPPLLAMAPEG